MAIASLVVPATTLRHPAARAMPHGASAPPGGVAPPRS